MMPTCVGILVKELIPGTVKTRMCPPLTATQAVELAKAMLTDCLQLVAPLGFARTIFVHGEQRTVQEIASGGILIEKQFGESFGARLANAQSRLFAQGYDRVLLLAGDGPTVGTNDVLSAVDALTHNDLALIPADDGGYVLLGANSPTPTLLEGVIMGTERVLSDTLACARSAKLRVALLDSRPDLDTIQDARVAERRGLLVHAGHTREILKPWLGRVGFSPS